MKEANALFISVCMIGVFVMLIIGGILMAGPV